MGDQDGMADVRRHLPYPIRRFSPVKMGPEAEAPGYLSQGLRIEEAKPKEIEIKVEYRRGPYRRTGVPTSPAVHLNLAVI